MRLHKTSSWLTQRAEWFEGDRYEALAICRTLELARAAFKAAVEEKPAVGS